MILRRDDGAPPPVGGDGAEASTDTARDAADAGRGAVGTDADGRVHVSVLIASMGRPSLAGTLRSVLAQDLPEGATLDIVVADDSGEGDARRIADAVSAERPGAPIRTVAAGGANIALARNATLEAARGDFVAFLDDDERADPDWLAGLLSTQRETGADAVFGPVRTVYAEGVPSWARRAGLYRKSFGAHGAALDTGSTCNALVRRGAIGALRFDPALGRTGGEDTDLFGRLRRAGGRLVASARGAVEEDVPAERVSVRVLRRRAIRAGHSTARLLLGTAGEPGAATAGGRLAHAAASLAKSILAYALSAAAWPFRRDIAIRFALKAWLNRGKVAHALRREAPRIY